MFFAQFIEKIELYPDENDVHKCIKSVKLMFPNTIECERNGKKGLNNETTVETVVLLRDKKVDGHISINLDTDKLAIL